MLGVSSTEEIDSYLYQTVGQDGLHFIAEALELPLYRRAIEGTAVDQGSDYASTSTSRLQGRVEGDETEDLYELLKQVLVSLAEHLSPLHREFRLMAVVDVSPGCTSGSSRRICWSYPV